MSIKGMSLFAAMTTVLMFASCENKAYKTFVGTWGVEKIEYYGIGTDEQGNTSLTLYHTFDYDPGDVNNGIQMIFRDDKTGEMVDSAIDTILTDWNEDTGLYDSYIYCPDTVIVYKFTYTYQERTKVFYMYMEDNITYKMHIDGLTDDSYIYENEYVKDNDRVMERAFLKRLSKTTPSKYSYCQSSKQSKRQGSLLGKIR